MGISKAEAIRALQTRENFFVAYSMTTNLPYVICDEESFNDQVWIFATEEGIKEFGKKQLETKNLIKGIRFEKKDFLRLYGILYSIGVNSVVWNNGTEKLEVELKDVARQADFSKLEPEKQPLFNSTLQLSGIYYMQALRRPVDKKEQEDKEFMENRVANIRELAEEFLVNLRKAQFLIALDVDPNDPKKVNVPYLKDKKEQILQPVFTDVVELQKFVNGKKYRIAKVTFDKLPGMLIQQAAAYVVNPLGFNLPLTREQMKQLIGEK